MVQNYWLPCELSLDDIGSSFFFFAGGSSEMHINVFIYVCILIYINVFIYLSIYICTYNEHSHTEYQAHNR